MDDLITLECPSCGGGLSVTSGTVALRCEHCGKQHMVRREAGAVLLESSARCPVCGRNDRVEKVSALVISQTLTSEGSTTHSEMVVGPQGHRRLVTREVPITQTQVSALAQQLAAPAQPSWPKASQRAWPGAQSLRVGIVGGLAALLLLCVGLAGGGGAADRARIIVIAVLLLAAGAGLTYYGWQRNQTAAEDHEKHLAQTREDAARRDAAWRRAVARWNQLYYCYRDGCVFLPGEGTFAPLAQMNDYLCHPA